MCTSVSFFQTNLGWWGLAGAGQRVTRLWIGHTAVTQVRKRAMDECPDHRESDWQPELRTALQRYADGEPVAFDAIKLNLNGYTDFQRRVIRSARRVPYGHRQTYGRLAAQAGAAGAARAVGNVMAGNRFPIIVPCHRIVLSSGGLGGFSAPRGLSLKRQLLNMESGHSAGESPGQPAS